MIYSNFGNLVLDQSKLSYNPFGNLIYPDGSYPNGSLEGILPNLADTTISSSLITGGASYNYVAGKSGWQLTSDGNAFLNNISLYGGTISYGKTAYTDDTKAGYWLGAVSGVPKFNIGSSATVYFHYNGTNMSLAGGTVSVGSPTGIQTILDSVDGGLKFYYNSNLIGEMATDTSNLIYSSNNHYFTDLSSNERMILNSDGLLLPGSKGIYFANGTAIEDGGNECRFDRQVRIGGNPQTIYPRNDKGGDCGSGDKRWSSCHAKDFYGTYNDIDVHDRYCPICKNKFELGDFTVLFLYAFKDAETNRNVPVHISCVGDYKKENHQEYVDFVVERNNYYETVEKPNSNL